jgi:hypothetical protein
MIEKIRKDFFKITNQSVFQSTDYFAFFGYSQHYNFKRFLDKEKYYPEIIFDSYSKDM